MAIPAQIDGHDFGEFCNYLDRIAVENNFNLKNPNDFAVFTQGIRDYGITNYKNPYKSGSTEDRVLQNWLIQLEPDFSAFVRAYEIRWPHVLPDNKDELRDVKDEIHDEKKEVKDTGGKEIKIQGTGGARKPFLVRFANALVSDIKHVHAPSFKKKKATEKFEGKTFLKDGNKKILSPLSGPEFFEKQKTLRALQTPRNKENSAAPLNRGSKKARHVKDSGKTF